MQKVMEHALWVAPHVGAWIETFVQKQGDDATRSRAPRGRVD